MIRKQEVPDQPIPGINTAPLSPDESKELISQMGHDWLYGPGMGDTALTIGSIAVFPPIGLYYLGNALLGLGGYEPVTVASTLPEEQGGWWKRQYDSVVSVPGMLSAAVAGENFRSRGDIEAWNRDFFANRAPLNPSTQTLTGTASNLTLPAHAHVEYVKTSINRVDSYHRVVPDARARMLASARSAVEPKLLPQSEP